MELTLKKKKIDAFEALKQGSREVFKIKKLCEQNKQEKLKQNSLSPISNTRSHKRKRTDNVELAPSSNEMFVSNQKSQENLQLYNEAMNLLEDDISASLSNLNLRESKLETAPTLTNQVPSEAYNFVDRIAVKCEESNNTLTSKEEQIEEEKKDEKKSVLKATRSLHYKIYSFEQKKDFIETYNVHGLGTVCLVKGVSVDTASHWVKTYKKDGFEVLRDKRQKNGKDFNHELDQYVLDMFMEKRSKGIPIDGKTLRALALTAPSHIKGQGFQASKGWLSKFLKRNRITSVPIDFNRLLILCSLMQKKMEKSDLLEPPTIDNLLDWCHSAIETLEPPLLIKAFEITGILTIVKYKYKFYE